jgi:FMN phosphatase YigB (HAD superfamily)
LILLVDLDGTLLGNSMGKFQPPYFKALSTHLEEIVKPDHMLPALIAGTRKMLENHDPLITLETAFDRHFYPALGLEKAGVDARIMEFYETKFPSLGTITHQLPEAIDFVKSRLSAGDRIVVATNPLFPRVATLARLAWAGLPTRSTNFDLITTYEFMHFSKPHPGYYAEILAYLGYPDEPVIMIGNDLSDDIQPADSLGIPGYWLTSTEPLQGETSSYQPAGSYPELIDYIKDGFKPIDLYATRSVPVLVTFLKATLAALHGYQLLGVYRSDEITVKLNQLIFQRHLDEISLVDEFLLHDKLTLNHDPPDDDPDTKLMVFSRYRMDWLEIASETTGSNRTTSESDLILLLQASVANDRKILMECSQWLKYLPEITRHPDQ